MANLRSCIILCRVGKAESHCYTPVTHPTLRCQYPCIAMPRHQRCVVGLPMLVGLILFVAGCESARTHYTRGLTFSEQGRHAEALGAYERALTLAGDDPEFLYNLGMTLIGHGYTDAGVEAFDRVIEIEPDHVDALYYRPATRPQETSAGARRVGRRPRTLPGADLLDRV